MIVIVGVFTPFVPTCEEEVASDASFNCLSCKLFADCFSGGVRVLVTITEDVVGEVGGDTLLIVGTAGVGDGGYEIVLLGSFDKGDVPIGGE